MKLSLGIVLVLAVGCGGSRSGFEPAVDAGSGESPIAVAPDGGAEGGVEQTGDCSDENKQIYVLSAGQRALHRFDPETLTFTRIGAVNCPTSSDTFSMAVDRKGTAWVEYQDGRLFHVSTKDASCTEVTFRSQNGFQRFGMGFAKDDTGTGETLFVAGEALGTIDQKTAELSVVGPTGLGLAELTGTGDGRLYAFVAQSGRVSRLDKTTGQVLEGWRAATAGNFAFAFAHWGGDFWLFTGTSTSSVTRFSPKTGDSTVVVPDAGMEIVGAGSSTCAPIAPPR